MKILTIKHIIKIKKREHIRKESKTTVTKIRKDRIRILRP
jgi:hypothetical protein